MASESDRCRKFERGLHHEIRTLITAIAKWIYFSQLVETALRVEQSIEEEKSASEPSRGASIAGGSRGREQRRFTPSINITSRRDFKNRSGDKFLRQTGAGSSTYPRQRHRLLVSLLVQLEDLKCIKSHSVWLGELPVRVVAKIIGAGVLSDPMFVTSADNQDISKEIAHS